MIRIWSTNKTPLSEKNVHKLKTNSWLSKQLPITFPIARSGLPLKAAISDVVSSYEEIKSTEIDIADVVSEEDNYEENK